MNRKTLALVISALLVGLAAGAILSSQQGIAFAQENGKAEEGEGKEKPVDVTALTTPSPVVAAMAYQAQTDYEQDPFEPTKLRRTTMQVKRVLIVRQDGVMEVKDAP